MAKRCPDCYRTIANCVCARIERDQRRSRSGAYRKHRYKPSSDIGNPANFTRNPSKMRSPPGATEAVSPDENINDDQSKAGDEEVTSRQDLLTVLDGYARFLSDVGHDHTRLSQIIMAKGGSLSKIDALKDDEVSLLCLLRDFSDRIVSYLEGLSEENDPLVLLLSYGLTGDGPLSIDGISAKLSVGTRHIRATLDWYLESLRTEAHLQHIESLLIEAFDASSAGQSSG